MTIPTSRLAIWNILQESLSDDFSNLPRADQSLLASVAESVSDHMARYDSSHDFSHALRVLTLSRRILASERAEAGPDHYSPMIVFLSALVHDVDDRKYKDSQRAEGHLARMLLRHGVPDETSLKIQTTARNVSYWSETKHPEGLKSALARHPEIAIVQDADRLDAIGAIGIGRTFAFGGAKAPQCGLQATRQHITDRLVKTVHTIKTKTGKRLAKERMGRLEMFMAWWDEEMESAGGKSCSIEQCRPCTQLLE
ncbi:hypothetical protein ASPVEDRAFT_185654 [Aspergillus versicolor CBS 583.65]|uniref:HD/PDEase domain-containing protein n=1 Tax=Aspergillus versicolor CBS 583.65 TaxID=1036611 RepID=A0A1L9PA12_ASPVE|nr:uncharacterized protein ASPVEDRAFT_185654 [Aspergillus versicolor CBS 583.65]OJI98284.1 hypothetical protein ASPVEDRAFT_185654 [Aspergillus versicolor CBS 583.65]